MISASQLEPSIKSPSIKAMKEGSKQVAGLQEKRQYLVQVVKSFTVSFKLNYRASFFIKPFLPVANLSLFPTHCNLSTSVIYMTFSLHIRFQ